MKKKMAMLLVLIVMIMSVLLLFNTNYSNKPIKYKFVTKDKFAILLENSESHEYDKTTSSVWPQSGYKFNDEMSYCQDTAGNRINEQVLLFDGREKEAYVNNYQMTFCYLYFKRDSIPPVIKTFFIGGLNNPEIIGKKNTEAYIELDSDDVNYYCISKTSSATSCNDKWVKLTDEERIQRVITTDYYLDEADNGTFTRYLFVKDDAENVSSKSDTVELDTRVPIANVASYKKGTNEEIAEVNWSSVGRDYMFTTTCTNCTIEYCKDTNDTCTPNITYNGSRITTYNTITTDYYIRYKITNNLGLSSEGSYHAKFDLVTPSVSVTVKKTTSGTLLTSGTWSDEKVTFRFSENTCGVSGCKIYKCWDRNNTCDPRTSTENGAGIYNKDTDYPSDLTGTWYLRYMIESNAGLSSTPTGFKVNVDIVKPKVSLTVNKTGETTSITSGTWSTKGLEFKLTESECGSTCTIKYCQTTGTTCTPNTTATSGTKITSYNSVTGEYKFIYQITSLSGLSSSTASFSARVDNVKPDIELDYDGSKLAIRLSDSLSMIKKDAVNKGSSKPTTWDNTYDTPSSPVKYEVAKSSGNYYVHVEDTAGNYKNQDVSISSLSIAEDETSSAISIPVSESVTCTSGTTSVATCSKTGTGTNQKITISGIGPGTAKIKVKLSNGSLYKFISVTVIDRPGKPKVEARDGKASGEWHGGDSSDILVGGSTVSSGTIKYYFRRDGKDDTEITNYDSNKKMYYFTRTTDTDSAGVTYYIKACNGAVCSDEVAYVMKLDKGNPTPSLTGGTTLKSASQSIILKCNDSLSGISAYYWGENEPNSYSDLNGKVAARLAEITSDNGLEKNESDAKKYWLGCGDGAGNFAKTSITLNSYTVKNLLLNITGTADTYTNANYTEASSNSYVVKSGTSLTLASIYTKPAGGGSYKGYSTSFGTSAASVSSTAPTVSNNGTYYMWFNRLTYTVTVNSETGGKVDAVSTSRSSKKVTVNSGENGSITGIRYGEAVKVTATGNSGYSLNSWTGGYVSGSTSPKTGGEIKADKTITASWKDTGKPTLSLTGGTTLKSSSQTLTLKCSDNVGVTAYYWGTTKPTSETSMNGSVAANLTKLTGSGLEKSESAAGTYWLGCRDAAGNWDSTSITLVSYSVNNVLLNIAGKQADYSTESYTQKSTGTYTIKSGTSLTLSSVYTKPTGGGSFKGYATSFTASSATVSTTAPTVSNGTTYYMYFWRQLFDITISAGANGSLKAESTSRTSRTTTASAGNTATVEDIRYGEKLKLTATGKTGFSIKSWGGDYVTGSTSPVTGDGITEAKTISVTFKDTGKPSPSISNFTIVDTGTNAKSTVLIKCSDNVQVTKYYWGTSNPSSLDDITTTTSISSLRGSGITKNLTSGGTYYLACRDAAGNWKETSITVTKSRNSACGVQSEDCSYSCTKYADFDTLKKYSCASCSTKDKAVTYCQDQKNHDGLHDWAKSDYATCGDCASGYTYSDSKEKCYKKTTCYYSSGSSNCDVTYKTCIHK